MNMAVPRLTFLYPQLFKSTYQQEAALTLRRMRKRHNITKAAAFSTHGKRQQEHAQRYGTAQEPQLPPPQGSKIPPKPAGEASLANAIEKEVKAPPPKDENKAGEKKKAAVDAAPKKKIDTPQPEDPPPEDIKKEVGAMNDRTAAIEAALEDPSQRAKHLDKSAFPTKPPPSSSSPSTTLSSHSQEISPEIQSSPQPLAKVLEMPAPTVEKRQEEHKTPHLQTPPYVHHFDTYTLVNDLARGGFTDEQSVSIMKAVRSLLAVNLDVAREGLVSKSDVENVCPFVLHFLFLLFCSPLSPPRTFSTSSLQIDIDKASC